MGSAVKNADKKETRGGLQNFGEKRHLLTAEDRSKAGKRTANRAKFRNMLACAAEDQIDKILKLQEKANGGDETAAKVLAILLKTYGWDFPSSPEAVQRHELSGRVDQKLEIEVKDA